MKLNQLSPAPNSTKARRRLGRGTGSGLGKTSGKGQKGQNSRSGGGVRPGFEGGQMPLLRRLPKMGFTNHFRKEYTTVNVSVFEKYLASIPSKFNFIISSKSFLGRRTGWAKTTFAPKNFKISIPFSTHNLSRL